MFDRTLPQNYFKPSHLQLYYLILSRFVPYALYHYYRKPYRNAIHAIGYGKPHASVSRQLHDALLDALYHILLDGYVELTGLTLLSCTGQMLFFLRSLFESIDDVVEQRLKTEETLNLHDLLTEPLISERAKMLHQYLYLFGNEEVIFKHLQNAFTNYLPSYTLIFKDSMRDIQFNTLLLGAQIDSGLYFRLQAEIISLFNGYDLDNDVLYDFYLFGMVGKFADDMLDFAYDWKNRIPNLIHALVAEEPTELAKLESALKKCSDFRTLNLHWWSENCPMTYNRYMRHIEEYFKKIKSPKLRFACHLALLPASIGFVYDAIKFMN